MSSLDRLRGRSPQSPPPISPTSSPLVRPPDPTITSTLPFLRSIYSTPGIHNSASFLREVFTEYLRLQYDITHSEQVDNQDQITLQRMKDMIALTKTIRGLPGHENARFHVVDYDRENNSVRKVWTIVVPIYRLSDESNGQRPTLNLAKIKLLSKGKEEECAADALSTEDYERMLHILISHIIKILGSDCVPVVMKPVTTDGLREYIEPVTRMGKSDTIEFPAIEGEEKPRFRLLGLSNREVQRLGWAREGEFGWDHVQEQEREQNGTDEA
jgi:hypothetical protein